METEMNDPAQASQMLTEVLDTSLESGVLWLRLNRPRVRNALDRPLCEALIAALQRAGLDPEVRAVVLTGNGKAFCAGDDITGLRDGHEGRASASTVPSDPLDGVTLYSRIVAMIVTLPKPVIAAINGATAGAGLEIACASDLRIASSEARMGSGLIKIAQPGNAVMLPRVVGEARATEIFLTGRLVGADEAARIGLVHHVYGTDEFEQRVERVALELAALPTKAIGLFKEMREANRQLDPVGAIFAQDRLHRRAALEIKDVVEGALAFIEKRSPNFTGE